MDRQDSFKTWSWGRCHLRSPPREGGDTGPGPPEVPGVGPGPGPAHLLHLSAPSTQAGRWVREWLSHARQAPGCAQGRSICLKAESDAPQCRALWAEVRRVFGGHEEDRFFSGLQVCTDRIKGRPADTSEPSAPTTLLPPSDLAPSGLTHHALDLRSHGKLRTPRLSLIPVRLTQGLLYTDRWPSPTPSFETVSFRLLIPARSRTERNLPALTPG